MQERIGHEHQRPMFSNGGSVSHAIIVKTKQLLAVLVKSLNRPTKQVSGNDLFGIPTQVVSYQNNKITFTLWIVKADHEANFAQ